MSSILVNVRVPLALAVLLAGCSPQDRAPVGGRGAVRGAGAEDASGGAGAEDASGGAGAEDARGGAGAANVESGAGAEGARDGAGGVGGWVGGTGTGGGPGVDCTTVGCAATPLCGDTCRSPCGCCPCVFAERSGDSVCTARGCLQPLTDGGADCAADTRFTCTRGELNLGRGLCYPDTFDASCVNGTWECPARAIPTSQCTKPYCEELPSGPCQAGDTYACGGAVYSFVDVVCTCVKLTWYCEL
jgi:hypothetical protein